MKLDTWQQYVKDKNLEAGYNAFDGAQLVAKLSITCKEAYEYIMDEVEGSLDPRQDYERILDGAKDVVERLVQLLATNYLNTYIKEALETIEEIEREEEQPEDCMDIFKRSEEMKNA